MNDEQRDEMLIEIHSDMKSTAGTVEALAKEVWGNGNPGLAKDFMEVKIQQRDCPARKANSTENKRLRLSHVIIAIAIITLLVNTYLTITS